jgi:tetraacyldisaccharide 4'-kinase
VLLRGYGGDEALVHARLNDDAVIEADPDRARGAARARARGATVAVLDDAFQHRRVLRDADLVLLSAERGARVRLLPAGPWREPLAALARASHVIVTRRVAAPESARALLAAVAPYAPRAAGAVAYLAPGPLRRWPDGAERALTSLAGTDVLAVSGIGDPASFEAQLASAGARVRSLRFGDHHRYRHADADRIASLAAGNGPVVCTLKDAVKLGPLWFHGAPPVWYLSQRVTFESGADALDRLLDQFARAPHS